MRNIIERKFLEIQDMILDGLLSLESKKNRKPIVDNWKSKIGKGKTCVIENGSVFEKAVVTFSSVSGKNLPTSSGMSANINKIHKFDCGSFCNMSSQKPQGSNLPFQCKNFYDF